MNKLEIPKNHPRYESLVRRSRLIEFYEKGIVTISGLISHGRGEAFDYILGEKSNDYAILSEKAALGLILKSEKPVISVNGNVAALADDAIIDLSRKYGITVEANIFHWSKERIEKIVRHFESKGLSILGRNQNMRIPGLESERGRCEFDGIYTADTVIIPLEDGDRAEALRKMGKKVITIDLNPLSRTSRAGHISIVDDVNRAFKNMISFDQNESISVYERFDNSKNVVKILEFMSNRLSSLKDWPDNL